MLSCFDTSTAGTKTIAVIYNNQINKIQNYGKEILYYGNTFESITTTYKYGQSFNNIGYLGLTYDNIGSLQVKDEGSTNVYILLTNNDVLIVVNTTDLIVNTAFVEYDAINLGVYTVTFRGDTTTYNINVVEKDIKSVVTRSVKTVYKEKDYSTKLVMLR